MLAIESRSLRWQQNNREKIRESVRRHHQDRKQWLSDLKAQKGCASCGFSDPRALDFHHLDPSEKTFRIADSCRKKKETVLAEIEKCEVLCANCHRIRHAKTRAA